MAQAEGAEAVPDVLLSLRKQSMEIGRMAMEGVRAPSPPTVESPENLLRLFERLKQIKFEQERILKTGKLTARDLSPECVTEERLKEQIKSHKKEIDKMKDLFHNKTLFVQRILLWNTIHSELLKKNSESKLLYDTIEHSMGLCTRILELQKETHSLEEQLLEVRKKRMQLRETSSTILTQIKNRSEKQKRDPNEMENSNLKATMKFLETERNATIVLQNVFQRIILASRVHWAEDPKLREIVLKLDKDPNN